MRLANDDRSTPRLQFKQTGEAMAERPPTTFALHAASRAPASSVYARSLAKPRDWRHGPEGRQQLSRSRMLLPIARSPIIVGDHELAAFSIQLANWMIRSPADLIHPVVEISPREAVARLTLTGHGMTANSVRSTSRGKIQHQYRAPMHMLVMYEKGERRNGETFVEGLPPSALRNLRAEADIRSCWPRVSRLARAARIADAAHVLLLRPCEAEGSF